MSLVPVGKTNRYQRGCHLASASLVPVGTNRYQWKPKAPVEKPGVLRRGHWSRLRGIGWETGSFGPSQPVLKACFGLFSSSDEKRTLACGTPSQLDELPTCCFDPFSPLLASFVLPIESRRCLLPSPKSHEQRQQQQEAQPPRAKGHHGHVSPAPGLRPRLA